MNLKTKAHKTKGRDGEFFPSQLICFYHLPFLVRSAAGMAHMWHFQMEGGIDSFWGDLEG